MKKPDVLRFARKYQRLAENIRVLTIDFDIPKAERATLRYVGVLTGIIIDTLENLHNRMHPVFDLGVVNGVLREWGLDELEAAPDKEPTMEDEE